MTPAERARAIVVLSRYVGTELTAAFIRHTAAECPAAGIPHLHSLSEGIFKPKDSEYALCVWSRSAGGHDRAIYPDTFTPRADGTWTMQYAAKDGPLGSAINRSLFACLRDAQPVLVIVTSRPKGAPGGARYRFLGPALIEDFDAASRRFRLTGHRREVAQALSAVAAPEDLEAVYLRHGLILPFPLREERDTYVVSRAARDRAFRALILGEYFQLCCVCKSLFVLADGDREVVEAEAAHIIPVTAGGPDDPRNGLSLCRRHHWAFDEGLFTLSSALEIQVSPAVHRARRQRFDLEEYHSAPLLPPAHDACRPDPRAVDWHRHHIFRPH